VDPGGKHHGDVLLRVMLTDEPELKLKISNLVTT